MVMAILFVRHGRGVAVVFVVIVAVGRLGTFQPDLDVVAVRTDAEAG